MEERWDFMASWCQVLQQHFDTTPYHMTDEFVWEEGPQVFSVIFPRRRQFGYEEKDMDEPTFRREFHAVQEALALLVAVEHADHEVYEYLLLKGCSLWEKGWIRTGIPIATRFLVTLDVEGRKIDGMNEYDLVRLCGTHLQLNPSDEYLRTLRQIALLDENLAADAAGVCIEIPVKLRFTNDEKLVESHFAEEEYADLLRDVTRAEKQIQAQWDAYSANSENEPLATGELRCCFTLEPAAVSFIILSPEMAEMVGNQMANNVWFSALALTFPIPHQDANTELESRTSFGLLLRRLFDSTRRNSDSAHIRYNFQDSNPSPVEVLTVRCAPWMPNSDFELMCSAMVVTQITKKLSLGLEIISSDEQNREYWWQWLAYSLFSRRARSCSSLGTLIFSFLDGLSTNEVSAFNSILESEHPEEMLFGSPRGLVDERTATLTSGSPIRWEFDDHGEPVVHCCHSILEYPMPFVRTFSDDGKSEWVNVLVPGFGRCQVQRCNLEFNDEVDVGSGGVTSLQIDIKGFDMASMEGLYLLVESIGSSLTTLIISGIRERRQRLDVNSLIRSCPHLQELTLSRESIAILLNFTEYRTSKAPVPELTSVWTNDIDFLQVLSGTNNPFVKCTQRLSVNLPSHRFAQYLGLPNPELYMDPLVHMLEANERLEYLEIKSCNGHLMEEFEKFHLKSIFQEFEPLSKICKTAFLSIRPARTIGEMDQLVLENIFSFASVSVLRRVYFYYEQFKMY
ncbi:hypothetical protein PHMEG_00014768 [Phytophthora megakarya]|uniref:Uncharacterized protein n=1 Tax=Phytophthora megakarya TaxID=4795 RepID=A0A225W512_9STRA|nr:hypothetical protein PHMEG_00014768 [Phytophthora megakarya]